jgi:hypothetical protein
MSITQNESYSRDKSPLLVGFLVDVSYSMSKSINKRSGKEQSRIQSFYNAYHDLISKAKEIIREEIEDQDEPLLKIFGLGFGFGNPLSYFLGDRGGKVRDLFALAGTHDATVTIHQMVDDWELYEKNLEKMVRKMFADTPMGEAFREAERRISFERENSPFDDQTILFVLSDGMPTDASAAEILQTAERLKRKGIIIISCYLTDEDVARPRHLYGEPHRHWPYRLRRCFP